MIRTDGSNAFAHDTMHRRVPTIIREVIQTNPDFLPQVRDALEELHDNIRDGAPIPRLELPAPDYDEWAAALDARDGHRWLSTDWFFAETYFYRRLIEIVRWWEIEKDPFLPKKREEIRSADLWATLDSALEAARLDSAEERLAALIQFSLRGNRIDLSYAAALAHGWSWTADDLLVDDVETVVRHLLGTPGEVHIVADNYGSELAMDLVLADALTNEPFSRRVMLHVKMHPMFVSDATASDVRDFIWVLTTSDQNARVTAFGKRLYDALESGRLRLAPDLYWNSSYVLAQMPPRLIKTFANAALVIFKGDLNYRRVMGDRLMAAETPIAAVTGTFRPPLLMLRSMKSDVICGLPAGLAEKLDESDRAWRTNGKRCVVQFREALR